jgi:uncharacterized protein
MTEHAGTAILRDGALKAQDKINRVEALARVIMPELPYHNFEHAKRVYTAVSIFSYTECLCPEEKFLLRTAALLHDVFYDPKKNDNEQKSAELAISALQTIDFGYTPKQAAKVGELIIATKMPQHPDNLLEGVICDADLDNLGGPDFFTLGEKVREELGIQSDEKWLRSQLNFLQDHRYHTESARRLRNSGKAENIAKLQMVLKGELPPASLLKMAG